MKDIPALSVDERHMMIMSNLGILVKLSKKLMARSISVLHKIQTETALSIYRVQMQDSNIQQEKKQRFSLLT